MNATTKRESFVFYGSFYNAICALDKEAQLELFHAVCKYGLNDEEQDISNPLGQAIFGMMKPNLSAAAKRYAASVENGKKGGRPSSKEPKKEPNNNLGVTYKEPNNNLGVSAGLEPNRNLNYNVNVNDNVNVNINENINKSEEINSSENKENNSSKTKRISRKEQLTEYISKLDFSQETKDMLTKWYFQVGIKGGLTLDQLRDKLKFIDDECSGDETLIREAINQAYLSGWFGFYKPNQTKTIIPTNKPVEPSNKKVVDSIPARPRKDWDDLFTPRKLNPNVEYF